MTPEERVARGGRDRSTPISEATKRTWEKRARLLERIGVAWVEAAARIRTPALAIAKMAQGTKCLDAADRLYARLARLGRPTSAPSARDDRPDSLDAYRQLRPRG